MSLIRIAAVVAALGLAAGPAIMAPARGEPARNGAAASPWVELRLHPPPLAARVRLTGSHARTAGGARRAGVEVAMPEGWKTYWRTPGDAGVPPQFDWSGSTNAAQIKVLYPAPIRMSEAGGEVIGYKHTVLFPIEVTPQDAAKPIALKLALELGVCRDICVPGVATLELTLPPGRGTSQFDAIAAAIELVPRAATSRRPTDPELRQVTIGSGEAGTRLHIAAMFPGGKGADVFVESPEGLYVPLPRKQGQDADGVVRFAADLPADLARDLKGKTLIFTLVSEAGATEARWVFP